MRTSLPRRSAPVAVLAIAASSGIGLVAATAPASAATRVETSLSIRVAHPGVNPGGGDFISGYLRARHVRLDNRWIQLQARTSDTTPWAKVKGHRTSKGGRIGFEVEPTVATRYRMVFNGNKVMRPSVSGVVNVNVRDTTSLVETLGAAVIQPGQSDTVDGVLSLDGAPIVGGTVNLRSKLVGANKFKYVASAISDATGSVSFSVTPAANTRYFLIFHKTATDNGATSAIETVHVQLSTSLSIRGRLNKAGQEVISGELRGGGQGLAGRKILLQDRATGTTPWTTVGTKRANKQGFVAFAETAPTASEDYQLVFAGGSNYAGCASGVFTVTVSTPASAS